MTTTTQPNFIIRAALHLLGIAEDFWKFIAPTVESDSQALLTQLAPIAVEAVTSLATDKTNTQFRISVQLNRLLSLIIQQAAFSQISRSLPHPVMPNVTLRCDRFMDLRSRYCERRSRSAPAR